MHTAYTLGDALPNMAEAQWEQKRAYLFSHPRTTTNLLLRMLSGQSEWDLDGYFLYDAFIYARATIAASPLDDVPQAAWDHYNSLREDALQRTHSILEEARTKKRHVLLKNHAYMLPPITDCIKTVEPASVKTEQSSGTLGAKLDNTNWTPFSDALMLSWTPIFIIRNPILTFESWVRAEGEPFADLTSCFARIPTTFTCCGRTSGLTKLTGNRLNRNQRPNEPYQQELWPGGGSQVVILDADDILADPQVMGKFCDVVGTDKAELVREWTPASELNAHTSVAPSRDIVPEDKARRFYHTINASSGIMSGKTSAGVTLDGREKEWIEEFGPEQAALLKERVEEAWPDYEYLRSLRLQA
ncbi:unnamed protein product [Zymoseptoria tritici ST99CH_3D7]|uniref:Sulfotransferase domain-containing protein n=1 Tax=Zymoseptoria tritici (strain ST99CH_3D7) TaxID=1276538 RepID=A0A1X7RV77_ZYMT9|nr:unnamed protein product [Zymoseptoria tritici ST99CH_3D7]